MPPSSRASIVAMTLACAGLALSCSGGGVTRSRARAGDKNVAPDVRVETFQSSTSKFPPPAPSSSAATSGTTPSPRAPRTAQLKFELRNRFFPLPLVHGTIGGHPTWMLVDTGANSHVIASWLAKQAGLALKPLGDVGTDHTGKAVSTYSVEHPAVAIDAWGPLDDGPMLVTDIPEPIAKLGIGAFISPQWLGAEGEGIVMDFVQKQLRSMAWDDAVASVSSKGKPLVPKGGRICEDTGSAIKGLAFVVPGVIEGQAVDLLVDTGAHRTDLLTTARAGQKLAPRSVPNAEQMYAASGLVTTRLVRGAKVAVGDWTITADIDLIPGSADPVCPRDGVVSMDVLKSCVLVLGKKQMMGRCGE